MFVEPNETLGWGNDLAVCALRSVTEVRRFRSPFRAGTPAPVPSAPTSKSSRKSMPPPLYPWAIAYNAYLPTLATPFAQASQASFASGAIPSHRGLPKSSLTWNSPKTPRRWRSQVQTRVARLLHSRPQDFWRSSHKADFQYLRRQIPSSTSTMVSTRTSATNNPSRRISRPIADTSPTSPRSSKIRSPANPWFSWMSSVRVRIPSKAEPSAAQS